MPDIPISRSFSGGFPDSYIDLTVAVIVVLHSRIISGVPGDSDQLIVGALFYLPVVSVTDRKISLTVTVIISRTKLRSVLDPIDELSN